MGQTSRRTKGNSEKKGEGEKGVKKRESNHLKGKIFLTTRRSVGHLRGSIGAYKTRKSKSSNDLEFFAQIVLIQPGRNSRLFLLKYEKNLGQC